jgi:hypothetical protein
VHYSLCGKPNRRFTLTSWQTIQIATLPWIVPVRPGTSQATGFARRKVSLPYGLVRESNYNILLEQMVYYSRYATGTKGGMLGFSLLQLVTFEPEVRYIPDAQPKQLLPCSSLVPATWHSIASVYPDPTKYVSASNRHLDTFMGFCRDPSPVPSRHGWWHRFSCTLRLLLADWVRGISNCALRLSSALELPPSEGVPLSPLWAGDQFYFRGSSAKG